VTTHTMTSSCKLFSNHMIIIPIMYVCLCNAVTERDVRECVRRGCGSLDELQVELGVGTCCGRCRPVAKEILDEARPHPLALAA
jgi:bacterioferritin-associated ferredoxin